MKKGQIISLDFLISLILVFLAFGTLIEFYEINSYNQKQTTERMELKSIAESAADLMVSSPELVCEVVDDRNQEVTLLYLSNCLGRGTLNSPPDWAPAWGWWKKHGSGIKVIQKAFLGIPEDFDCNVFVVVPTKPDINQKIYTDCDETVPAEAENVFVATRKIMVNDVDSEYWINKSEFNACQSGGVCPLVEGTITLKVWKK